MRLETENSETVVDTLLKFKNITELGNFITE